MACEGMLRCTPQIAELFKLPGVTHVLSCAQAPHNTIGNAVAHEGLLSSVGALGSFSNTELIELVIASEVFELHGQAGNRLRKIALAAAKRWAGADQTASGLLVTYLKKNVQSYKYFVVSS